MIERILLYLLNRWQNRGSLKTLGAVRSSEWRKVRAEHLKNFPICAVCGGTETLEVHHVEMFSQNPNRELDPTNLITLCESGRNGIVCHRAFGHLGNYQSINKDVRKDTEIWYNKLHFRP